MPMRRRGPDAREFTNAIPNETYVDRIKNYRMSSDVEDRRNDPVNIDDSKLFNPKETIFPELPGSSTRKVDPEEALRITGGRKYD